MTQLNGLILAGGKSQRMGQDKALLQYHGKPQIEYAFDLLSKYCGQVFLSKRKEQNSYGNLPSINDADDLAGTGPLGGVLSAMRIHPNAAWIVVACDLPFVNDATLKHLIAKRDPKKFATAFISSNDNLPEPLCAIWEAHSQHAIKIFLSQGIQCARKVLIKSDTNLIHQDDPKWLENINTPEEFKTIAAHQSQTTTKSKTIHIQYYAILKEERGLSQEDISTRANDVRSLYQELREQYKFRLNEDLLKVAVNNEFRPWETLLKEGDSVVFIPPVAGG